MSNPTGVKHDTQKPPVNLLPGKALLSVARVLAFGAGKYGANNWRNGIQYSRLLAAAERHLLALNDGELLDGETGESHVAHAICELLFLLQQIEEGKSELNDLPIRPETPPQSVGVTPFHNAGVLGRPAYSMDSFPDLRDPHLGDHELGDRFDLYKRVDRS